MLNFENTEIAFKSKSDKELRRAYYLFRALANPSLVTIGNAIMGLSFRLGIPLNWVVKKTIYQQFVGGETLEECRPSVRFLEDFGVKAILDYSVEGKDSADDYQHALEETLRSIDNAALDRNIAFAVFKPSALISTSILERLSQGSLLAADEITEARLFDKRVEVLCQRAFDRQISLLIDAEYSWQQEYLDALILNMMRKYNKEKAIVFNTLQMYRTDRLEMLSTIIETARSEGFFAGLKFVRGAYMEVERERAKQQGYPSPIHPNKPATDQDFDAAIALSMENLAHVSIFCGTHNEKSCLLLAEKIHQMAIDRSHPTIYFAQLYGMSDHISFNLANEGYNSAKYVPYGPVKHVIPYLSRRAEENTSVAGQTSRELTLIRTEQNRRKTPGRA